MGGTDRGGDKGDVMERLIKIILGCKSTLGEGDLRTSRDLYGDGLIDSLDIIIIIDELRAEYGIEIKLPDISRADFMNVQAIYELVNRFGGK